jgi:hypothetical protein
MKKIVIVLIALITFQANAQHKEEGHKKSKKERHHKMKDISPEDMAQLHSKKLTLALDLTEAQQKKVNALSLKQAKVKKAKMEARMKAKEATKKRSQEERLKAMNERLDAQIANKKEMKAILNAEQYEKWERMQAKRKMVGKKRKMGMRKGKKRERHNERHED